MIGQIFICLITCQECSVPLPGICLTSLSVDEILLPIYGNVSTISEIWVKMAISWLERVGCIFLVHMEVNASSCFLQTMLLVFVLSRCICKKHKIISVVCVCASFCGISSAFNFFSLFVTVSYQAELDTRSITRRSD